MRSVLLCCAVHVYSRPRLPPGRLFLMLARSRPAPSAATHFFTTEGDLEYRPFCAGEDIAPLAAPEREFRLVLTMLDLALGRFPNVLCNAELALMESRCHHGRFWAVQPWHDAPLLR
jgi:hypothetical protein